MTDFNLLEQAWKRIEKQFQKNEKFICALHPGASEAELADFEKEIGLSLPAELKHSFKMHNGDRSQADAVASREKVQSGGGIDEDVYKSGIICGLELMTLSDVRESYNEWREIEADADDSDESTSPETSFPVGAIKDGYTNPGWIGLISDSGGNYIGVDLAPGPKGTVGQVISFGRDEITRYVLAKSWSQFLDMVAKDHENFCSYDLTEGTIVKDRRVEDRAFTHYTDFLTARCRSRV